jgi:hypothetical protein
MGWEEQGRQDNGWFGEGTGATKRDPLFRADRRDQRIQAVIHGAVGALPASLPHHPAAQPNTAAVGQLTTLMVAWDRGATLDRTTFAERFFDRAADDPVAAKLREAACTACEATSHDELRDASEAPAEAQLTVGLDRWYRFLADATSLLTNPKLIGGALVAAGAALALTGIGAAPGAAAAGAGASALTSAAAIAVTDAVAVGVGAAAAGTGTVLMTQKQAGQEGDDPPKLTRGGAAKLGNLKGTGIESKSVAEAIRSRGGTGAKVNEISSDLRQLSVAEIANKAATGERAAMEAPGNRSASTSHVR